MARGISLISPPLIFFTVGRYTRHLLYTSWRISSFTSIFLVCEELPSLTPSGNWGFCISYNHPMLTLNHNRSYIMHLRNLRGTFYFFLLNFNPCLSREGNIAEVTRWKSSLLFLSFEMENFIFSSVVNWIKDYVIFIDLFNIFLLVLYSWLLQLGR